MMLLTRAQVVVSEAHLERQSDDGLPSAKQNSARYRSHDPLAERRASKPIDPPLIGGRASTLPNRHALLGQLPLCMLVFGEMRQTHTTQHIGGLGELDVVVADDLDAVTPGVAKV
jgi:hypothetical protein